MIRNCYLVCLFLSFFVYLFVFLFHHQSFPSLFSYYPVSYSCSFSSVPAKSAHSPDRLLLPRLLRGTWSVVYGRNAAAGDLRERPLRPDLRLQSHPAAQAGGGGHQRAGQESRTEDSAGAVRPGGEGGGGEAAGERLREPG